MAKGKRPGDTPPVQKGTGSITKKKPETKAADAAAAKPRKPKSKSNTAEDDEVLIASLISCASGSEKKEKKEGLQQDLDMELVAALAAEACLPARHAGCDSRCVRFFGSSLFWFVGRYLQHYRHTVHVQLKLELRKGFMGKICLQNLFLFCF